MGWASSMQALHIVWNVRTDREWFINCACGNNPCRYGLEHCDDDGIPCFPGESWSGRYVCNRCHLVILPRTETTVLAHIATRVFGFLPAREVFPRVEDARPAWLDPEACDAVPPGYGE